MKTVQGWLTGINILDENKDEHRGKAMASQIQKCLKKSHGGLKVQEYKWFVKGCSSWGKRKIKLGKQEEIQNGITSSWRFFAKASVVFVRLLEIQKILEICLISIDKSGFMCAHSYGTCLALQ